MAGAEQGPGHPIRGFCGPALEHLPTVPGDMESPRPPGAPAAARAAAGQPERRQHVRPSPRATYRSDTQTRRSAVNLGTPRASSTSCSAHGASRVAHLIRAIPTRPAHIRRLDGHRATAGSPVEPAHRAPVPAGAQDLPGEPSPPGSAPGHGNPSARGDFKLRDVRTDRLADHGRQHRSEVPVQQQPPRCRQRASVGKKALHVRPQAADERNWYARRSTTSGWECSGRCRKTQRPWYHHRVNRAAQDNASQV